MFDRHIHQTDPLKCPKRFPQHDMFPKPDQSSHRRERFRDNPKRLSHTTRVPDVRFECQEHQNIEERHCPGDVLKSPDRHKHQENNVCNHVLTVSKNAVSFQIAKYRDPA